MRRARLVEGGPAADRDGGLVHRAVGPRVTTRRRSPSAGQGDVVGHGEVGRREPQLGPAPAVAVDHRAPHLVGPAQQRGGPLDVALGHQGRGSGWTTPARRPVAGQADARPPRSRTRRPSSVSRATLPRRPWPKWKSSPTTTSRAAELVDQHLVDEVLGRLVGPLLVEGDHHGAVDAAVGQQLELLVEVGQQLGCRLGAHHGGRVAVEGDHHGGQPGGLGPRRAGRAAGPGGPRWTPS